MNSFPVHKLSDKTDLGFELKAFDPEYNGQHKSEVLGVHRDDHYIFFLLTKGTGAMMVDFEEQVVHQNQLYYILPEQVHYRITTGSASGWFIAVDPSLIAPECRALFDSWLGFQAPVTLSPGDLYDYNQLLSLLYGRLTNDYKNGSNSKVLYALLLSFLAMAAESFSGNQAIRDGNSRLIEIALQFKKLLNQNFRQHKSPSTYAEMLHISEPYLNESVKKVTGSPVTFWVKQEILIEAKRMLYYTELNVKQVADELGYENYSYFCRFFRKEANMSALAFRKKNLRTSVH